MAHLPIFALALSHAAAAAGVSLTASASLLPDILALVFFICFLVASCGFVFMLIRSRRTEKRNREYLVYQKALNSTVRACRAIYYINAASGEIVTVYPLGADGKPRRSTYDKELVDRLKYNVIAPEHRDAVVDFLNMDNIRKRLAERDHVELQFKRGKFDLYKRETAPGGYEWCSIAITVAEKKDNQLVAFTISIRSIDDMILREEEQKRALALAVAKAEAASHAKSDFLSRMSHDIRTPMNAILGMTTIAAMHIDEKNRALDALEKITISGRHLLRLINDVLDMSKIESGKLSLSEEKFNLAHTIDNVLSVFHTQMEAKGLGFDANIGRIEHENVIGDEHHLQQIFMNIMGNAVKFTPEGGNIAIHIEESPSPLEGHARYEFAFADNGIGMEPEFVKSIFEPFSRAENSEGNKIEGTGLGMSIAVSIARMMGGDIKVESAPGKGSRFTVIVQLKLDKPELESLDFLAGLPALVAADETSACEYVCETLKALGMKAEFVQSGDAAVKNAATKKDNEETLPVVLLDWQLPGKTGLETAMEIRHRAGKDIAIIIFSAYDWSAIETKARDAGVNSFISKPLFRTKLLKALKEALGQDNNQSIAEELEKYRETDFRGEKILLVEDNDFNIDIAKEFLSILGIEVETAANGQIALDMAREKGSDYYGLILMDIQMPVMNGYESAKAIRSLPDPNYQKIPIIALTADAFSDDIKKAKAAGMNDHLSKPISLEHLAASLRKWLAMPAPQSIGIDFK